MTIAAGILPLEEWSIVLAADTKFTVYNVVNYAEKIYPLTPRDSFRVVLAGSTLDADVMKIAAQRLDDALPQAVPSMSKLCGLIERHHKLFYDSQILPLVKAKVPDTPEYQFLIAVWSRPNGLKLLKTNRGTLAAVNDYELIGSGQTVARGYDHLAEWRLREFEAVMIAIHWVRQAKIHDLWCGGDTTLYSLTETGALKKFDPVYIHVAESHFKELDQFFGFIAIPMGDGDEIRFEHALNENMSSAVSDIRRYRDQLIQMYDDRSAYHLLWQPAPI